MRFYWLIIGVLGVWRLTHLLQAEDGPWNLIVHLRQAAGAGFFGKLMDCFYCLSVWVAFLFAVILGGSWKERLLLWPALSGAAILLEKITTPPQALYTEDKEKDYVLLRQTEITGSSGNQSPSST